MKRSTNFNGMRRYRRASGAGAFVELCRLVGMTDQQIAEVAVKATTPAITAADRQTAQPSDDRDSLPGLAACTGPGDMPDDPAIVDAAIAASTWSE